MILEIKSTSSRSRINLEVLLQSGSIKYTEYVSYRCIPLPELSTGFLDCEVSGRDEISAGPVPLNLESC